MRLVDLDVLRSRAEKGAHNEPHIYWYVDFAPEPEESLAGRVVFGTLHAFGAKGGGEVMVGSIVLVPDDGDVSTEAFREALVESDALETLYDYARTALRTSLALVDVKVKLPRVAPEPVVGLLVRPDGNEDSDTEFEHAEERSTAGSPTVTALKNYDYLIRSKGLDDVSLDWETNTLVWGDGGSSIEESLTAEGFTPATRK